MERRGRCEVPSLPRNYGLLFLLRRGWIFIKTVALVSPLLRWKVTYPKLHGQYTLDFIIFKEKMVGVLERKNISGIKGKKLNIKSKK